MPLKWAEDVAEEFIQSKKELEGLPFIKAQKEKTPQHFPFLERLKAPVRPPLEPPQRGELHPALGPKRWGLQPPAFPPPREITIGPEPPGWAEFFAQQQAQRPALPPPGGIESAGQAAWQIAQVPLGFGEQALANLRNVIANFGQSNFAPRIERPPLPPAGIAREVGRALGGTLVAPEIKLEELQGIGGALLAFPPTAPVGAVGPVARMVTESLRRPLAKGVATVSPSAALRVRGIPGMGGAAGPGKPTEFYVQRPDKTFREVKGKSLTLPGYEDYDFFIHRPLGYQDLPFKGEWAISEGKTGLLVGRGRTQADAIKSVTSRIEKAGGKTQLDSALERKGAGILSPRYGGVKTPSEVVQAVPLTNEETSILVNLRKLKQTRGWISGKRDSLYAAKIRESPTGIVQNRGLNEAGEKLLSDLEAKDARFTQFSIFEREERLATPKPLPPVTPGVAKELWAMTVNEYKQTVVPTLKGQELLQAAFTQDGLGRPFAHRMAVLDALREGKPVPPSVLADYPDLAKAVIPAISSELATLQAELKAGRLHPDDYIARAAELQKVAPKAIEARPPVAEPLPVTPAEVLRPGVAAEAKLPLGLKKAIPTLSTEELKRRVVKASPHRALYQAELDKRAGIIPKAEAVRPPLPEVAPSPLKEVSPAEIRDWRSKGLTPQDIAELKTMSPELRELHAHQARITGFRNVSNETIDDYLQKALALAKKRGNKKAIESLEAAVEYNDAGILQRAILGSEKGLGQLHMDELAEMREALRVSGEALMFPKTEVAPQPLKVISRAEMDAATRLRQEAGLLGPPPGVTTNLPGDITRPGGGGGITPPGGMGGGLGGGPPPVTPGGGIGGPLLPPVKPSGSGITQHLAQAKAIVERDRPGIITRLVDYVPGLKQIQHRLHPALDMPEGLLTGWVGEGNAMVSSETMLQQARIGQLAKLEAVFGKNATAIRDFRPEGISFLGTAEQAKYPKVGNLADIMQRPSLYSLSAEQRAALATIYETRTNSFRALKDAFGLDIREFPVESGGVHLANVGIAESDLEMTGGIEGALLRGRAKERFYATAADRWAHDPTFEPETTISKLFWADDTTLSRMAGRKVLLEGAGGKNRLQVMTETHPDLAQKMETLKKQLQKLSGYERILKEDTRQAISDFLASPLEDVDLATLREALDVRLEPGRYVAKSQAGRDYASVLKERAGIRAQIKALQPSWRTANLKPYVLVQEGVYRYFPAKEANQVRKLLKRSESEFLRFADNLRATAFGGDFSPISIQGAVAWFSDPVGVSRFVAQGKAGVTQEALLAEMRANPESWQRFTMATGINPLGGVSPEFAVGFPGKIPKVGKYWTGWNEALYRPIIRIQKGVFDTSYASALKHGLTPEQAAAIGGDDATKIIPRISYRRLGQSEAQAAQHRAVLTSVSFLIQPTALMGDATKGLIKLGLLKRLNPSETFALRRVTTLVAAVEAISVMSNVYHAKTHDLDMGQAVIDSLNPDSGYFMSLVLPNGARIGLGGPFRSLIRAVAPREVPGVPIPIPFAGVANFGLSKMAPFFKIGYDEIRDKDFYGKRIRTGDFPLNIIRGLAYALTGVMPLTIGSAISGLRRELPAGEIIPEVVSQFGGVNLTLLSPYQAVRQWATANPSPTGASVKAYNDIPTSLAERQAKKITVSRLEYRKRHPEIDAQLFVIGQVSALQTTRAIPYALRIIQEMNIDWGQISGIQSRQKLADERRELELPTLLDTTPTGNLLRQLQQRRKETPTGTTPPPQPTPTPTPSLSEWEYYIDEQGRVQKRPRR